MIPSWRFFRVIEPSPRIEIAEPSGSIESEVWHPWRPRPARVGALQMLGRLFWNPWWNQCLYLTSLAERVVRDDCAFAREEIRARICADLPGVADPRYRIVLLDRDDSRVVMQVAYTYAPES